MLNTAETQSVLNTANGKPNLEEIEPEVNEIADAEDDIQSIIISRNTKKHKGN